MKCLIDTDILVYECAYAGEYKDEETDEKVPRPFDDVIEVFEQRLKEIEDECWANEPSLLFLTGDERLLRLENRQRKRDGQEALPWVPNFRIEVAKSTPYKARKSTKPYHYHNLRAYILSEYRKKEQVVIAWGMEADDMLSVLQDKKHLTTIICSRDKDLRQVPGMQYSWECGAQPGWGPTKVEELGEIELPKPNKLVGTGLKFFFAQAITGDPVDTIPGLPRGGPSLAYKTLAPCETEEEMYNAVADLYERKIGEGWEGYLEEQLTLLWLVRELDEHGEPVPYRPPERQQVCSVLGEASV